jgi:hypothetical protein
LAIAMQMTSALARAGTRKDPSMRSAFLLTAVVAVAALTAAPAAQADLSGAWTLSFNTPNGAMDASATFKVDGEKLSGTLSGPAGETPLTGNVKGKAFTFNIDVQSANGNFSVTVTGEQDGDSLKGTFDFGQGTGDWTGKRK